MGNGLEKLEKLPRAILAHTPTPIEHLPNLSVKIGGGRCMSSVMIALVLLLAVTRHANSSTTLVTRFHKMPIRS